MPFRAVPNSDWWNQIAFKLKVSNDGTTFVEALTFDQSTGNAAFQRGLMLTGVISPSQITSNQNDYAPTGFSAALTLRLSSDASRNITGLAGGAEGRAVIIHNVGVQGIVLTDQDSASTAANRFLLGGSVTLTANASLSLRYDGTTQRWRPISPTSGGVGGGGGGGAAGMTDTEGQNLGLSLIYQSKSFAEYRRLVNVFATGFKGASDALNGILTGSSSHYTVTPGAAGAANGSVAPSTNAPTRVSPNNMTSNTAPSPFVVSASAALAGYEAWKAFDNTATTVWYAGASLPQWLQIDLNTAAGISAYKLRFRNDGAGAVGYPTAWTLQGSNDGSGFTVIDTQTGAPAWSVNEQRSYTLAAPQTYRYYRLNFTAGESSLALIGEVELTGVPTINNMTLVTAAQTADAPVSNVRALIEYDNTAAPVFDTDLTIEVTCDGGANWASASLSAVTSYSQGGRKLAETVDQACAPGTDFRARIKTLNSKNVPIYGVSLTAH